MREAMFVMMKEGNLCDFYDFFLVNFVSKAEL